MALEQQLGTQNTAVSIQSRQELKSFWKTIVVLFKLRIVSLLLLSAYGGAVLGMLNQGQSSGWAWFVLTVSGILSAAGASGTNQYLERDRDRQMKRTARRPLAQGAIAKPRTVLLASLVMMATAVLLAATVNMATAVFIALGALIYVAVYTMWLKPRTIVNIVIGGAAGSCAVLSGGAAMGVWSNPTVWLLATLIFVWTPVHFWALALAYRDDYAQANFPMLPTRTSPQNAARWTAIHTLVTILCGVAIGIYPTVDLFYLVPIAGLSLLLLQKTWQLLKQPEKRPSLTLFHFSNIYLAAVLLVILLMPIWR